MSPQQTGNPTYWKKVSHQAAPMQEMADKILNTPSNSHNPVHAGFRFAAENINVRYDGNYRRNKDSASRWDCSEFVQHAVWAQNAAMKAYAKHNGLNLKTNFDLLEKTIFSKGSATAHQQPHAERHLGFIARGSGAKIEQQELKEGMVIFQKFPPRPGSKYDGHVGMVVRDPETGNLMIAESTNAKKSVGVIIRTVHDFLHKGRAGVSTFFLSDPYKNDRPLLDAMSKKVEEIRQAYHKASNEIERTPSALMKVSYRQNGVSSKEALLESRIRTVLSGGGGQEPAHAPAYTPVKQQSGGSLLERLQNMNKPLMQQNPNLRVLPNLMRLSELQEQQSSQLDKPQLKMPFDFKGIFS